MCKQILKKFETLHQKISSSNLNMEGGPPPSESDVLIDSGAARSITTDGHIGVHGERAESAARINILFPNGTGASSSTTSRINLSKDVAILAHIFNSTDVRGSIAAVSEIVDSITGAKVTFSAKNVIVADSSGKILMEGLRSGDGLWYIKPLTPLLIPPPLSKVGAVTNESSTKPQNSTPFSLIHKNGILTAE